MLLATHTRKQKLLVLNNGYAFPLSIFLFVMYKKLPPCKIAILIDGGLLAEWNK